MKISTIAALAVSGAMFVAFVFLALRGQGGEAAMMAGASLATLLLLGQSLHDQATKDAMIEELRARAIQQVEASAIMGALAKEALEGRVPEGAITVISEVKERAVEQGVFALECKVKATAQTSQGREILSEIATRVKAGGRLPARGYAEKEHTKIRISN